MHKHGIWRARASNINIFGLHASIAGAIISISSVPNKPCSPHVDLHPPRQYADAQYQHVSEVVRNTNNRFDPFTIQGIQELRSEM